MFFPLIVSCFSLAAEPFPEPYDSQKGGAKPMPPAEAATGFKVPSGFIVDVFAAEPDVRNPIAITWDNRCRLWVAENYTYAERDNKFDLNLRDRVLIFMDADGDGKPEKRTIFIDTVQRLTSVEVGLGGVWLMCPPQLLFVPDKDGDDKPDAPPEVMLEGFDVPTENHHNFANGLRWGPDGWLYGRCGASAPGKVRRPDQHPSEAIPLAGGIWRYHPKTKVFEPLCHGTTNPWGHDWDESGEAFFVNSVNGHLWHLIPGAHFRRPHTISPNRLVYEPMEMIADHWHFDTGKGWTASRNAAGGSDELGGGHAHSGAVILKNRGWPDSFKGRLLTLNLHGRRANVMRLERVGSGYVGRREPDTLKAADPFFRGIDLIEGPESTLFVIDWSDTGECHEHDGVHRNSGRIFRLRPQAKAITSVSDWRSASLETLAQMQTQGGFPARRAARELIDRQAAGHDVDSVMPRLTSLWKSENSHHRLRAVWLWHALGVVDPSLLQEALADPDEHVRAWAIRLLTDHWPLDTVTGVSRAERVTVPPELLERFAKMATTDNSGLVRLVLASTLQRLPMKYRPTLAAALLSRTEDATDSQLPFLIWYGLIPLAENDPGKLVFLAANGKFPRIREWTARRLSELLAKEPGHLNALLMATADKPEVDRRDLIRGMTAGLAGIRKAVAPAAWSQFPKHFTGPDAEQFAGLVRNLEVVFGDGRALDEVRRLALDTSADLAVRKAALETLIEARPEDLRTICERLLRVRFLNSVALRGLTQFADPGVGKLIASSYRSFHPSERTAVVEALSSRPEFAAELLAEVAAGRIPAQEITAVQARQIRSFQREDLSQRLREVWGELRDSPKDKAELIRKLTADLTPSQIQAANPQLGRVTFNRLCAGCHRLYGVGESIGPDLTGAGRKDLHYLLSNIIDPSAVVTKDFQITVLALIDGRVITGIIVAETPATLTVQTEKARMIVSKEDIEKRTPSNLSLMPDGLLQSLSPEDIRNLIAYLMTDSQVPLPAPVPGAP